MRYWKHYALTIPDLTLRRCALQKLTDEHLNPEAAAFFAILGPRRQRRKLVRLMVAYQIMYDYLDAINESADAAHLRNGLQLHRALKCAVGIPSDSVDYYQYHPQQDDGRYLATLMETCQQALNALPSIRTLTPLLTQAADRCGEAQSRNHATLAEGDRQLVRWTKTQRSAGGYLWWELVAAGISCLSLHALFAAASVPQMTLYEAEHINMTYFPSVCALSALLDSLIDYVHDQGTTNHSFAAHYDSSTIAAERFTVITDEASTRIRRLSQGRRHKVILVGIACFYLSASEATTDFADPVTKRVIGSLGHITRPVLAVMRAKRGR